MRPEQWNIFKRAAKGGDDGPTPLALIIDSPWIPGYLGISHLDYYLDPEIWFESDWSLSEQLTEGRKDLVALLGIKIMPDGEIRDIWFDRRSGNPYLDESARKALLKSNPLPPLPPGFKGPFLEQGLRFTPSGLQ